jgi:hypothetical protein
MSSNETFGYSEAANRERFRHGDADEDQSSTGSSSLIFNHPLATALVAGALGVAIGAVLWRNSPRFRKSVSGQIDAMERAIELAQSGAVRSVESLKQRLADEGYLPDRADFSAMKKQLKRMIASY